MYIPPNVFTIGNAIYIEPAADKYKESDFNLVPNIPKRFQILVSQRPRFQFVSAFLLTWACLSFGLGGRFTMRKLKSKAFGNPIGSHHDMSRDAG